MKKAILVILLAVFVFVLITSCNKNVCPAYVLDNKTEQVKNNS